MKAQEQRMSEPLCRFGPGGDYIWLMECGDLRILKSSGNSLNRALAAIAETVQVLLGVDGLIVEAEKINYETEETENAIRSERTFEQNNTSTGAITKNYRIFPDGVFLFADDRRVGTGTGDKPKHRVRAYRRPAKKRTSIKLSGQSTFFESDLSSARTA